MARRKPVVPGAGDAAAAAPTPPARSPRRRAAAAAPGEEARLADLPPKIQEAVAGATKMSHAKAVDLASKGELKDRVLTEHGWYIPEPVKPTA